MYLIVAALGALSCLVLMFYINAAYAGVTIGKVCSIYIHVHSRKGSIYMKLI